MERYEASLQPKPKEVKEKATPQGPKLVNYNDDEDGDDDDDSDDDSDDSGEEQVVKNDAKKAVDFGEMMRAKLLAKKQKYDKTPASM